MTNRRRVSGGVLRFGRPVTPTQTGGAEPKPFENSRQQLAFNQLKFAPNMCEKYGSGAGSDLPSKEAAKKKKEREPVDGAGGQGG